MIPVEGHKHLYREDSGAIVNTDTNGYANYIKAKNKKLTERREIEDLRNEIDELKNQLRQLLERWITKIGDIVWLYTPVI